MKFWMLPCLAAVSCQTEVAAPRPWNTGRAGLNILADAVDLSQMSQAFVWVIDQIDLSERVVGCAEFLDGSISPSNSSQIHILAAETIPYGQGQREVVISELPSQPLIFYVQGYRAGDAHPFNHGCAIHNVTGKAPDVVEINLGSWDVEQVASEGEATGDGDGGAGETGSEF